MVRHAEYVSAGRVAVRRMVGINILEGVYRVDKWSDIVDRVGVQNGTCHERVYCMTFGTYRSVIFAPTETTDMIMRVYHGGRASTQRRAVGA